MYSKTHSSCNFKVKMENGFYYTTLPWKHPTSIQAHIYPPYVFELLNTNFLGNYL